MIRPLGIILNVQAPLIAICTAQMVEATVEQVTVTSITGVNNKHTL